MAVAPVSKEISPVTAERGPGKDLRLPRTIAVAAAPVPATPFSSPSPDSNREVAGARAIDVVVPPAPDGVPAVERVRELVSFQVMRLQEAGGGELRVVVKPDTGTQLSLNLRQHEDAAVTVQAVVERGNFELLNRHWPELQQQLESRGVRLTPLAQAETSFGGGSEGFRQPATSRGQHAGDEEPSATTATRIPGLPTATATAFASKSSSARLETWA
ncbi:MAG TPA: hypothetical protein VFV81_09695 [Verrucomicrobiae bacterium]|nr:hypothetical protein [Verrucomicrobiae bacterium]